MTTGKIGETGSSTNPLVETAHELQALGEKLSGVTLHQLPEELERLARHNPALLVVGSVSLGLSFARRLARDPESRNLADRPRDWGHASAAHQSESSERASAGQLSSDEPVEAPGRLGDLRHLGTTLYDKAGEVGSGQPGNQAQLLPHASSPAPSAYPRLKDAQPVLLGAIGVVAGALLAALLPDETTAQPQEMPDAEPPTPPQPEVEPMPRRSHPGPCP